MDYEWLTAHERLTRSSKGRYQILGNVRGVELPSVLGTQSSEKDLVAQESDPTRTKIT